MKIHYTSGHFYIEKDGKKIKIANQNEAEDACWRSDNRINDHISLYNWKRLVLKEVDTFDLPKELSVEVKSYTCNQFMNADEIKCPRILRYPHDFRDCCGVRESVAILSKSSSLEIPDSSEKPVKTFEELKQDIFDYLDLGKTIQLKHINEQDQIIFDQAKTISDLRERVESVEVTFIEWVVTTFDYVGGDWYRKADTNGDNPMSHLQIVELYNKNYKLPT